MADEVNQTYANAVKVAAQFEVLSADLFGRATSAPDSYTAAELGYVAQAVEQVEEAIFDALNALSSHLHDAQATQLLGGGHGWAAAKKAAGPEAVAS